MNKKYIVAKSWIEDKWLIPTEKENENLENEWFEFVRDSISDMIQRYEEVIIQQGLKELEEVGCVKRANTPSLFIRICNNFLLSKLQFQFSN